VSEENEKKPKKKSEGEPKASAAKAAPAPAKKPANDYMLPERWAGMWKVFAGMGAIGILGAGAGYAVNPTRFAYAWLFGFLVPLTLALGAIFFVLVQHLTSAGWSVTVRRTAEFFAAGTPALAVLVIPLAVSAPVLYGNWMNAHGEHGAEHGEHGEPAGEKGEKKDEHSSLETPHAAMTLAQNDVPAPTQRADAPPAPVASALAAPQTALAPTKVGFEAGKKDIAPAAKTALAAVANFLKANPTAKVELSAFVEKADDAKAIGLATERGDAVAAVLVDMGIGRDRIVAKAPAPVAPGHEAKSIEITTAIVAAPAPVTPPPAATMAERFSDADEVPVVAKKDHGDPEEVIEHEIMQRKGWWLSKTFFYARIPIYVVIWLALGMWLLRTSTSQDKSKDVQASKTLYAGSPIGIILFALSLTGAAFDWIMSLDATWYSTIFGVTFFAGCAMAGLATLIVVFSSMRNAGILTREVTVEHYHDIGKLMFGFMCFWAYVSFSQFMLIWYAAIPEETTFFHHRWDGDGMWKPISLLIVFFHFALPFVAIMSRNVKRRIGLLRTGAVLLLAMHVIEQYWFVMPNVPLAKGEVFMPSWIDLACLLGPLGVYLALVFRTMTQYPIIPVGDPRLERALKFENA
jgi:outer membrane protein OmpA-like peptidoglycan-associated protein